MSGEAQLATAIEQMAREEGFARTGVAPAGAVGRYDLFMRWLGRGCHAGMEYMGRNLPQRQRPDVLVEGAKSVICLAVGYAPPPRGESAGACAGEMVARYARGRDYHKVLRERCKRLMDRIQQVEPSFRGRAFVDSAPIMERALAVAGGLGWIGENGCLIVPGLGSYVVLCEIVSNLQLPPAEALANRCDNCGRCAAACPTGAILADGLVDCRRCVSYLTIEHRGLIEPEHWRRIGTRVFGCDACQEACPFNEGVPAGDRELTGGGLALGGAGIGQILAWKADDWDAATRGSATRRADCEMFVRNAVIAAGNSGDGRLVEPLTALRMDGRQDMDMIDWALDRLKNDDDA